MRNTLLRTTSIAVLGFGLAAAPLAFAQDQTQPATPPAATSPAMPADPAAPNTNVPEEMAPGAMPSTTDTMPSDTTSTTMPSTTDTTEVTDPAMETERVTIVGGTQPTGTVLATDLQGEPVENSAGEDLATLDDFVIDDEGRIVGAVVSFGGFLGMGEKQVLLPWEELTIDGDEARVTLAMSAEQIEALPAFEPVEREASMTTSPATTTAPATPAAPAPTQ